MENATFWTKSWENLVFGKGYPVQIQKYDQKIDGVDRFHQNPQSLHSPISLPVSSFYLVTSGNFDLLSV